MKKWLINLFRLLSRGGLTKGDYKNIAPLYDADNRKLWTVITILLDVVSLALFISSYILEDVTNYRFLYFGFFIYSIISSLLFFVLWKDKNRFYMRFLLYLNSTVLYVFGIFLGLTPADECSVSFMVMLVVIPLVILDKPWHLIVLNGVAALSYIVTVLIFKDPSIQTTEVFNTITYFLLGSILDTYLIKTRFHGYVEEYRMDKRIHIDALTDLGNDLAYLNLSAELEHKVQKAYAPDFAVVMMDLNNVKTTNDTYGHTFGCALIVEAGHYIGQLFQTSKCFHIGGDEFVAVLMGEDYDNKEQLLEEFDEKMKDYCIVKDGIELRLVIARGMTIYNKEYDHTYKEIMERADSLMYANKRYVKELYHMPNR